MSEHDDRNYLGHILEAVQNIEQYVDGYAEQQFLADDKTKDAVLYKMEVIGEAAGRLSKELKTKHAEVPWVDMSGMRNVLVHEYAGVDFRTVWKVYKNDLPELKKNIEKIIAELG